MNNEAKPYEVAKVESFELVISNGDGSSSTITRRADAAWSTEGVFYPRYLQLTALIDEAIKATDKGQRVYLTYESTLKGSPKND